MKKFLSLAVSLLLTLTSSASLTLKSAGGWNESAWMEFTGLSSDYTSYNGYVSADGTTWTKLDAMLVRSYGSYGRVDAPGLKAGNYTLKVVPVKNGAEVSADAVISSTLTVKNFNRSGYAHHNATAGVGAYNNDGTLKAGARVLYVTGKTAKTVSLEMECDKGKFQKRTGLQDILQAYEKGNEARPLAIRIIGTIKKADMDALGSSAIGLQVKGKSQNMNLTIEGVGNDATLYGFGVLARNCRYVEFRNFAIMLHPEDGMSFDTNNEHVWGHNLDIFYGQNKGGDKSKGDGSFDVKGTLYATVDNNHYWDTGKCNLNSNGDEVDFVTYHHNWFDHSDSRHPRVRKSQHLHAYNNYYDGNAKYGIGATTGSCIFSENNYFRNCKYPMLISMQGSDIHNGVGSSADTKGTFSSEAGGIIKAFGNLMTGQKSFEPYKAGDATYSKHFDAYKAESRDEKVPAEVVTLKGGTGYNNFDTSADFYTYTPDEAKDVPANVTGSYGAGRCQKGDFSFTFNNAVDDAAYDINTALETKLKGYASSFVKIIGDAVAEEETKPGTDTDPKPGTGDETGTNPKPDEGNDPAPAPGEASGICHFTGKKPSLGMVTVAGNYSNSKGTVTYNGQTYNMAVKMESATEIVITPVYDGKVTLVFGGDVAAAGKKIKIDNVKLAVGDDNRYAFDVKGGTSYSLKKGDSINLFLILIEGKKSEPETTPDEPSTSVSNIKADDTAKSIHDISGRKANGMAKGRIYIVNGKKYIGK